jgi:hypothetical protein
VVEADESEHPAVQRAGELLAELSERDIDEHAAVLEQAHAHLQSALAEADRPIPTRSAVGADAQTNGDPTS